MLVVTRKTKQSLMIGTDVEIVILESKDGSVKIGINAPRDVKVYRKEIFDEIVKENSEALSSDISMLKSIFGGKDNPL